jgi:hypothetical protein
MSTLEHTTARQDNGYGVAAMVLGIVAVVAGAGGLFIFGLPLAIAGGILATVFGFLGRRRVQRGEANNGAQALVGLILGPVAIVLASLWIMGGAIAIFSGPREGFGPPVPFREFHEEAPERS